nr:cupin [Nocardia farcinica]
MAPSDYPVRLQAVAAPDQPDVTPELEQLYRGFEKQRLVPLWTEMSGAAANGARSRWPTPASMADHSPRRRCGPRSSTLCRARTRPSTGTSNTRSDSWSRDPACERSSAVRPMNRGGFVPQAGWNWHAHHNATDQPMARVDGLDIPFQYVNETQFFEFGREEISDGERITPERCRSERLWGHPGLRPVGVGEPTPGTPLLAYKWENTDRALADQLAVEREAFGGTAEPGHAAVSYTYPATGRDVLPTIRAEFLPVVRGAETAPVRATGSSVYQVFDGSGTVTVGDHTGSVNRGDLFVMPPFSARSEAGTTDSDSGSLDLFRFSDAAVFEALQLDRTDKGAR